MSFDINNFVIDRIRRGYMLHSTTSKMLWSVTQVTDASLKISSDSTDATDAIGNKIMTFYRAKNAEFSASNSLFDLNLAAAQSGTEKKVASSSAKIRSPYSQIVVASGTSATLDFVPVGVVGSEIPYIYAMKGDDTFATTYEVSTSADATHFVVNAATKTITLPTGLDNGTRIWIPYEYETDEGVMVEGNAVDFPKGGKFILEVYGHDVCDQTTDYIAYVTFPAAKLKPDFDLNFSTDGKHPFTIECSQAYCDSEKKLFAIYVPKGA